MKNIKTGDKVRIKNSCTKYEGKYNGETGIIAKTYLRTDGSYGNISISLTNQHNKNSAYGYFYFADGDFNAITGADTTSKISPNLIKYRQELLDAREESSCFTMEYITEFKGEEKMRSEKIINLWRDNQNNTILSDTTKKEAEILNLDPLYSSVKKHVDEIDKILSAQGFDKLSDDIQFSGYTLNTTGASLRQNNEDKIKSQRALEMRYTEICAMLSACDTYEQEMEILKVYDIIGEDGKLADDIGDWR